MAGPAVVLALLLSASVCAVATPSHDFAFAESAASPVQLSGRVLRDGTPISDALVTADGEGATSSARTDATGNFQLSTLVGPTRLTTSVPTANGVITSSSESFDVLADRDLGAVVGAPTRNFSIVATDVDARPVSGVTLTPVAMTTTVWADSSLPMFADVGLEKVGFDVAGETGSNGSMVLSLPRVQLPPFQLDYTSGTSGISYARSTDEVTLLDDVTYEWHLPEALPRPPPPSRPTAVPLPNFEVGVSWERVVGSFPDVTDYLVTASPGEQQCRTSATGCTVSGLIRGTAYTFTVTAININGESAMSEASEPVIAVTGPGSVAEVIATAGDQSVQLTWTPVDDGGSPALHYIVTEVGGIERCSTVSTSCIVSDLRNGTEYWFRVMATNAVGSSAQAQASNTVIPAGVPLPPPAPTVVPADSSVAVRWAPAYFNGRKVFQYVVTASPGGNTCVTDQSATECTVMGLTNGTSYTFTVRAINAIGESAPSPPSEAVVPRPLTGPSAPTPTSTPTPTPTSTSTPTPTPTPTPTSTPPHLAAPSRMTRPVVVVGANKIVVKWRAATANGSPVTRYLIDFGTGVDRKVRGEARRAVFKRVQEGRNRLRIAAINAIGRSPYSPWVTFRTRWDG